MKKLFLKILFVSLLQSFFVSNAQISQLFRNKDRVEQRQEQDTYPFSYGFFLNLNNFDYKMVLNPKYGMYNNQNLVQSKLTYSFGAGLIAKMRLNNNFDLRLEPGLQFVDRELTFDTQVNSPQLTLTNADRIRKVKSTYVDVPLLLEFHMDRWYNSRPYVAGGFNYMMNLQSNAKSADDNQQGIFRSTTHNFGWSAEMGIQFYFSRFKLTPGFRGTFFFNNEMVADNAGTPPYWTAAINTMQTRAFMFVLKFE
ncbi:porin family protein [Cloacibacterium sp.]|uniref:type IX secretion/gliding motility protein PorT/SprT n=1 Tax=Cloacibacterium sp. TaxID=1913682 RepID=UPI0039E39724